MKKRWPLIVGLCLATLLLFLWPRHEQKDAPAGHPLSPFVPEERTKRTAASSRILAASPGLPVAGPAIALSKAEQEEWAQGVREKMKISLAAFYTAEKSFYSEYQRYSTDFNAAGYSPDETKLPYKLGFVRAFNPQLKPGEAHSTEGSSRPLISFDDLDQFIQNSEREEGRDIKGLPFTDKVRSLKLDEASGYCRNGCSASEDGFELMAVSNLDDDSDLDVWLINERKELVHVHDDLEN